MKRYLSVILLISTFILFSCESIPIVGMKLRNYGSTVELIESGASASVEYKSYNAQLIDIEKRAKNEMWSTSKLEKEKNLLSQGGYIIVKVNGFTIDSANTKYWSYIIMSSDNKILKQQNGRDSIPNYSVSQYGTKWWNLDLINLDFTVNTPFKVYVIDKLSTRRSGFMVYPDM